MQKLGIFNPGVSDFVVCEILPAFKVRRCLKPVLQGVLIELGAGQRDVGLDGDFSPGMPSSVYVPFEFIAYACKILKSFLYMYAILS